MLSQLTSVLRDLSKVPSAKLLGLSAEATAIHQILNENLETPLNKEEFYNLTRNIRAIPSIHEQGGRLVMSIGGRILPLLIREIESWSYQTEVSANDSKEYDMVSIELCEGDMAGAKINCYIAYQDKVTQTQAKKAIKATAAQLAEDGTFVAGAPISGILTLPSVASLPRDTYAVVEVIPSQYAESVSGVAVLSDGLKVNLADVKTVNLINTGLRSIGGLIYPGTNETGAAISLYTDRDTSPTVAYASAERAQKDETYTVGTVYHYSKITKRASRLVADIRVGGGDGTEGALIGYGCVPGDLETMCGFLPIGGAIAATCSSVAVYDAAGKKKARDRFTNIVFYGADGAVLDD